MTVATGARLFELPLTPERERAQTKVSSDGGRLTLGQKLECVWEGLSAAGAAPCPLCGGRMLRAVDAARCTGCGSTLT
jgi:hypothetical protein